jgi:hypothetical protein
MSHYFSIEIDAPIGLTGIETYLPACLMPLQIWQSGYNDKIILRAKQNAGYEFSMESSDSNTFFASGEFFTDYDEAFNQLQSFSQVLVAMKLAHQILIDNDSGFLMKKISYQWRVDAEDA